METNFPVQIIGIFPLHFLHTLQRNQTELPIYRGYIYASPVHINTGIMQTEFPYLIY